MYYQLTVPSFIKGLRSLSACLDKGAAYADKKKFDSEVLATSRLAPTKPSGLLHRMRHGNAGCIRWKSTPCSKTWPATK